METDSLTPELSALTAKQREALDLLLQHKTSKEMSRILGVSPHTVDQRIETAKKKFRVSTRGELARAYSRSLQICQKLTYEDSHMAYLLTDGERSSSDETNQSAELQGPDRTSSQEPGAPQRSYRVIPELFSGPSGVMFRVAAILVMATIMIVAFAGGVSIFLEMTEILGR